MTTGMNEYLDGSKSFVSATEDEAIEAHLLAAQLMRALMADEPSPESKEHDTGAANEDQYSPS